ncbi:MAG: cytochrome C oxidase subunit IV family protein [Acidobacteria bacterium]|nr:cytochrome C oxidase subunit IV family protein [Acidobacteriota bacterium]
MLRDWSEVRYGVYWRTWFLLLVLTLMMVLLDQASMSRIVLVWILLAAMLMKASLIGAYFMHLRFEKLNLVLMVVVEILLTAAALFFLIAPDGIRILERSQR